MTLVLDGTNNTYLSATERGQLMTLSTAQTTTSGTSIDFTGIPTWAKKITVMFNGVSTTGTSATIIQLGSGSITTTGYVGSATTFISGTGFNSASYTSGIATAGSTTTAADARTGQMTLTNVSGNIWVGSVTLTSTATTTNIGAGSITLSSTLDRIRITTVGGTDTFDAGSVNILIEGSL